MYLIDLIRVSSFIFTVSIYHLVTFPKKNFLSINYPFYQTIGLNFSWCFLDMTISKTEKLSMKRILFSQSNVFDEFIRWFNEFRNYDRNYESMIFFSGNRVCLFILMYCECKCQHSISYIHSVKILVKPFDEQIICEEFYVQKHKTKKFNKCSAHCKRCFKINLMWVCSVLAKKEKKSFGL